MLANHNLKIGRRLILRDLRFHKVRGLFLILASALVTGLYAFVFLLSSSVKDAFLLNYEYTYGSTSHILYTGLTEHQADLLSQHPGISSTVRLSTVGQLTDPIIGQRLINLAVADRDYAQTVLSIPTTGRLPENPGEIAMDEFTMDSLGVLHEQGAPVTLQWTDPAGQMHTTDFTLCGWWASPTNFSEACAFITAGTAAQLVPGYDGEDARNVTLGVMLYQPGNLDEQAGQILQDQGISGVRFTTNLAYNDARQDQANHQALPFFLPALLVLLCGYLMMYSILRVTAERDSAALVRLKSLGMTPRQTSRMLAERGTLISLLGILPGWLIGFVLHMAITSRVITGMQENTALYFMTWPPFAFAALCTWGTTLLASLLPARRLRRLTPAEETRMAQDMPRGAGSGTGRLTLARLALRMLARGRGRTLLSAFSLLLSAALLCSVWIRFVSLKEDLYLAALSPWDYAIVDGSAALSMQRYNQENRAITGETVEMLKARPEVLSVSTLKSREITLSASAVLQKRLVDYYNQPYDETMTLRESQKGFPDWCEGLDRLEQTGEYTALVIGLDGVYLDYILEFCPFTSGEFDAQAFSEGKAVLAAGAYHEGISTPAEGETVTILGRSFQVMGSCMHDDTYISGSNSAQAAFHIAYILPLDAFDALFPDQGIRQLAVNIDHGRQEAFEAYLSTYEQGLNRGVSVTRRSEYQANFEAARLNAVLPDLIVAAVLLGIALLNFANMLVVKAVSRRREFAVYESMGMTRAQLRVLMLLEGTFHALLMVAVVAPLTALFSWAVMPSVIERMGSWCMVYTFSLAPLWLLLPAILALSITVPLVCLHWISQGSIQDRLRFSE